jgi:hypothetical protein
MLVLEMRRIYSAFRRIPRKFAYMLFQNQIDAPEDTGKRTKGLIMLHRPFIMYGQALVISHLGKAAFDLPALPRTCLNFDWAPTSWLAPHTAVKSRDRRLDAPSAQALAKSLAAVGFLCDQLFRTATGAATFLWHTDARQHGLRQLVLVKVDIGDVQADGQAAAVNPHYYVRALANFDFADAGSPF